MPVSGSGVGPILCAVDGSTHAPAVAYTAAGLALQLETSVTVVRADERAAGSEAVQLQAHAELETLIKQSMTRPSGNRILVAPRVVAGHPGDVIRQAIASTHPSMVVMGSRGRRLLSRSLLGSTGLALLRDTAVPLVLVPPSDPEVMSVVPAGSRPHVGGILIPVDLNGPADSQLRLAGLFARGGSPRVTLLHATREADRGHAETMLNGLKSRIPFGESVDVVVVTGDATSAVTNLISEFEFGVVVLGRDPHHAGALASEILHNSNALVAIAP